MRKLFKSYLDYISGFKDRYFLAQAVSKKALTSMFTRCTKYGLDDQPFLNERGEPMRLLVQKFNFQWDKEHFEGAQIIIL